MWAREPPTFLQVSGRQGSISPNGLQGPGNGARNEKYLSDEKHFAKTLEYIENIELC